MQKNIPDNKLFAQHAGWQNTYIIVPSSQTTNFTS